MRSESTTAELNSTVQVRVTSDPNRTTWLAVLMLLVMKTETGTGTERELPLTLISAIANNVLYLLYCTLKSDDHIIVAEQCPITTLVTSSISQPQRREGESWSSLT